MDKRIQALLRGAKSNTSNVAAVGILSVGFATNGFCAFAEKSHAVVLAPGHTIDQHAFDYGDINGDFDTVGTTFNNGGGRCSGTFINKVTFLTAGHCVNNGGKNVFWQNQVFAVTETLLNPEYNPNSSYEGDWALLQIDGIVDAAENAFPVLRSIHEFISSLNNNVTQNLTTTVSSGTVWQDGNMLDHGGHHQQLVSQNTVDKIYTNNVYTTDNWSGNENHANPWLGSLAPGDSGSGNRYQTNQKWSNLFGIASFWKDNGNFHTERTGWYYFDDQTVSTLNGIGDQWLNEAEAVPETVPEPWTVSALVLVGLFGASKVKKNNA
jgi:hypothetical protein